MARKSFLARSTVAVSPLAAWLPVNRPFELPLKVFDRAAFLYYVAVVMTCERLLGGFEHLLLLAILRLEDNAYGATVRRELIECADKDVAVGAIYTGLDRLEEKGFVDSWMSEPTAKRGGRGKRIYRVTSAGRRALSDMDRAVRQLSAVLRTEKGVARA